MLRLRLPRSLPLNDAPRAIPWPARLLRFRGCFRSLRWLSAESPLAASPCVLAQSPDQRIHASHTSLIANILICYGCD